MNRYRLPSFVAAAIALIACSADAQQIVAPGMVDCASPFAKNSSHAKLATAFGSQNVKFEEVGTFEEFTAPATIVYQNDPRRRLEFIWRDKSANGDLAAIWIRGESQWTGPLGMRLGMPISEVEKLNTKPFRLNGFDWDYGGLVTDWQGGATARLPGGCQMSLMFVPDPQIQDIDAVVGERKFLSNDKKMRAVKPFVARIFVTYKK
jgi:hypothetical protein